MRNVLTLILTSLFLWMLSSCEKDVSPAESTTFTLKASYGTDYKIYLKLPTNYDASRPGGYPLLVYTDGDYLTTKIRKASVENRLDEKVILVGIGYASENRRTQDYSPTPTRFSGTGNAPEFARFIESDLIGFLRKQYNVSVSTSNYTLCGHSLGGLFGTYMLLNKPQLFANYLLISSALMWDEQRIFRIESEQRGQLNQLNARVFLGTGTVEENGTQATKNHLVKLFKTHYPSVSVREVNYRNTDHEGVIYPSLQDGLRFIYSN